MIGAKSALGVKPFTFKSTQKEDFVKIDTGLNGEL